MKKFLKLFILLIFISPCIFVFSACDSGKDNRQAPVYQGMVVSAVNEPMMMSAMHFNPDNPFGDNAANIEDHASSLFVLDSTEKMYYADSNEDVFITIKLSNPDSFEIMSFTLNGVKYSSYMFEDGSDLENLILKVNVGNIVGVKDYTIDAIKYVDKTEIKDVVMDGDKTIKIGLGASNSTYSEVTNSRVYLNKINLSINLIDIYNLIEKTNGNTKVVIYDGVSIIDYKDLAVGRNDIVFDKLNPNTVYQFAIISAYDDLSGNGTKMHTLYKNAFCTNAILSFNVESINQTSINFNYIWDNEVENKTIVSQELYLDETKISNIDISQTFIQDLLSNREYTIVTTYKNLNNISETIQYTFTTFAKETPNINLTQKSLTQTDFEFVVDIEDLDNVGSIEKIELLHDDDGAIILNNEVRTISDLLSDNDYTIKVSYSYDVNDGSGEQTIIKELSFHTLSKSAPVVVFKDISSLQSEITFNYELTDNDNICTVTKAEIYEETNKIKTITDLTNKTFNELNSNTEYTIKLWYSYDLNDGMGIKETFIMTSYYTMASEITVTAISTLNETNPKVGEEIHVSIAFNNPSNIEINSFYINGINSEVVGGNKISSAIVKFIPDFEGGEYQISLTKISYLRNGNLLTQNISSDYSTSILVLGSLKVKSFERESQKDYFTTNDDNIVIELDNPTNYNIFDIHIKYNSTEKIITSDNFEISNNVLTFKASTFNLGLASTLTLELTAITYGIEGVTAKADYNLTPIIITYLSDSTVNEITTIEQFKNMQNNKSYKLMNDLDFANESWTPIVFEGVLDGNNHKIKNLSYVTEVLVSTNYNFALFSQFAGVIKNLEIDSMYISVYGSMNINIAGIAITTGNNIFANTAIIKDCIVTGDIYIKSNNQSQSMVANIGGLISKSDAICKAINCSTNVNINIEDCEGYEINAGGIIGKAWTTDKRIEINKCSAFGNITINKASTVYAGGIAGYAYKSIEINNCYTTGDMTVTTNEGDIDIGGLVGHVHIISISNCYTTGNLYAYSYYSTVSVGGLMGDLNLSSVVNVNSCYTVGNLTAICETDQWNYASAGSMISIGLSSLQAQNFYKYENQVINTKGYSANQIEANMQTIWEFIQSNWDSSIWNLHADKNPTLK